MDLALMSWRLMPTKECHQIWSEQFTGFEPQTLVFEIIALSSAPVSLNRLSLTGVTVAH